MLIAVCICFREHESSSYFPQVTRVHCCSLIAIYCILHSSPVYEWMLSVSSSWAPAASSCRLARSLNYVLALGWSDTDLYSYLYRHKAIPYWRMGSACLDNTSISQGFRSRWSLRSNRYSLTLERQRAGKGGKQLNCCQKTGNVVHVGSVATCANTTTSVDVQGHQCFSFLLYVSASYSGSKERSILHPSTSLTSNASCDLVSCVIQTHILNNVAQFLKWVRCLLSATWLNSRYKVTSPDLENTKQSRHFMWNQVLKPFFMLITSCALRRHLMHTGPFWPFLTVHSVRTDPIHWNKCICPLAPSLSLSPSTTILRASNLTSSFI